MKNQIKLLSQFKKQTEKKSEVVSICLVYLYISYSILIAQYVTGCSVTNILTKSTRWKYWARTVTNKIKKGKAAVNLENLNHIREHWARWISSALLKGRNFLKYEVFSNWSFQELFRTSSGRRIFQISTFFSDNTSFAKVCFFRNSLLSKWSIHQSLLFLPPEWHILKYC